MGGRDHKLLNQGCIPFSKLLWAAPTMRPALWPGPEGDRRQRPLVITFLEEEEQGSMLYFRPDDAVGKDPPFMWTRPERMQTKGALMWGAWRVVPSHPPRSSCCPEGKGMYRF